MFLLYIDPGTGSALFSIIIGLIASAYFLGKAAIIKLKFLFITKKERSDAQKKNSIVIYCEGKQYYTVFEPIIAEFEKRQIPVTYLTSEENDEILSHAYSSIFSSYIGKGNKAFAKLNLLEADICLMTTPGLDVYQLKRSKHVKHYAHILHAVDDATSYRLFGIDYYDSILLSGEYQIADIRKLEELRNVHPKCLPVVGSTYLDALQQRIKKLPKRASTQMTVLVAPSWGANGILSKYGEKLLTPLVNTGFQIIIRPHPQSMVSENEILDFLKDTYKNKTNISWDFERDNLISLSNADILISDFSGVIFDYVFLFDKPFLFVNQNFDLRPYDADDIQQLPWKFRILPEIGVELTENKFEMIKSVIEGTLASTLLEQNRKKAKAVAWQYQGEAAKRVVDFLTEIKDKI